MENSELLKFISFQKQVCSFTLMDGTQGNGTLNTIIVDTSGRVIAQIACPTPSGTDTIMQFPAVFIKSLTIIWNK